jgi:hypothetical protein
MKDERANISGLDVARWVIYALLSALTVAIGFVALAQKQSDLGISFLAGGIASILFLFQKVVDDLAASGRDAKLAIAYTALMQSFGSLDSRTRILADQFHQVRSRLAQAADDRVIFARHLTEESRALIAMHEQSEPLEIDAIGISLKQFLIDHATLLRTSPWIQARLLILDPETQFFDASVGQEGRNPQRMREQIQLSLQILADVRRARDADKELRGEVELRWIDASMTTTGVRVGRTWFIRPRFQNEANSFKFFFERYDASSPKTLEMVSAHFDALWDDARLAVAE